MAMTPKNLLDQFEERFGSNFADILDTQAEESLSLIGEGTPPPFLRLLMGEEPVVTIVLKKHMDESSYRNALLEAAIAIPHFGCDHVVMCYETADDDYGFIAMSDRDAIGGMFCDGGGNKLDLKDEWRDHIDVKTLGVLHQAMGTPGNARYLDAFIVAFERRGHQILWHVDQERREKLPKSFFV